MGALPDIPERLQKYLVIQHYDRYTPVNHAVWRYLMRQLRAFLARHAHPSYLEGLEKTGVTTECIPHISDMSRKLETFGWRAVPVSGFLPPAVFIELQSLAVLPIGADMRSLAHLLYTPAPDIVHEAAGHAPILANREFSEYLKRYGQAARRAIFNQEDLALYEAIRELSDLKEHPASTTAQVATAEARLAQATKAVGTPSEAALLARMNWWTAEYGLIGAVDDPKIYGAGLLSSLGEARGCLAPRVKKIPFSLACLDYDYDITEPQPHLFVTPDFATLSHALDAFIERMAFRRGGQYGLEMAKAARTVNTVVLNSGLQISGRLADLLCASDDAAPPRYLRFAGPVQLACADRELEGHGIARHADGFGTPLGLLAGEARCLSEWSVADLRVRGIAEGKSVTLHYASGVIVEGTLRSILRRNGKNLLMTFAPCTVRHGKQILFDPAWGEFDMACGSLVPSVFGGPADRGAYGEDEKFAVKHVPPYVPTTQEQRLHALYQEVRDVRERERDAQRQLARLDTVRAALDRDFPDDWLLRLEMVELACTLPQPPAWQVALTQQLESLAKAQPDFRQPIRDGLALCHPPQTVTQQVLG